MLFFCYSILCRTALIHLYFALGAIVHFILLSVRLKFFSCFMCVCYNFIRCALKISSILLKRYNFCFVVASSKRQIKEEDQLKILYKIPNFMAINLKKKSAFFGHTINIHKLDHDRELGVCVCV